MPSVCTSTRVQSLAAYCCGQNFGGLFERQPGVFSRLWLELHQQEACEAACRTGGCYIPKGVVFACGRLTLPWCGQQRAGACCWHKWGKSCYSIKLRSFAIKGKRYSPSVQVRKQNLCPELLVGLPQLRHVAHLQLENLFDIDSKLLVSVARNLHCLEGLSLRGSRLATYRSKRYGDQILAKLASVAHNMKHLRNLDLDEVQYNFRGNKGKIFPLFGRGIAPRTIRTPITVFASARA